MAVTETIRESWISRLGNSIRGVLVGVVLFVAGFPVLFWNEGNSVRTAKALAEGEGACVALDSVASVDQDYEGRLVHATARAETAAVLADEEFGVSANAIRLERQVEMFQWEEESSTSEKKNLGGSVTKTTTYTYHKTWSDSLIDSSDFKEAGHDNPAAMPYESLERVAEEVRFGAFRLNERQIDRIGGGQELALAPDYACPVASAQRMGNVLYIPGAVAAVAATVAATGSAGTNATNEATVTNAAVAVRNVASAPQVGDVRVTFRVVLPHVVSIVARQRGDTFSAYVAKNGKKVDLLAEGTRDAAEMFAAARRGNAIMTWILRFVGFLLMYMGLSAVLKPLSVIGDVVPFIGTIIGMGAGLVAGTVALACALVTIAIAWIFYRPILGIVLLAAAGFLVWRLMNRARDGGARSGAA